MQSTGRSPILSDDEQKDEVRDRQTAHNNKRETRKSLMTVVAKATDVLVKRAPLSGKGELPHTRLAYHEKIVSCRRREE